jgi:O-antigen/teichoic acid export membrane protein
MVLRFSSPQALMMAMATSIRQLDIFLVQLFYSTRTVGIYNAAKMLYRVFETGADAAVWLMYPTAVRLLHEQRQQALQSIIGKALVLQIAVALVCVGILELGGTSVLVGFLGSRYAETTAMFNVMAVGAVFLPLVMLQSVHLALHRVERLLSITAIGVGAAMVSYVVVGRFGPDWLIGIGVVVYAAVVALLLWYPLRRDGIIEPGTIGRAFAEIRAGLVAMASRIRIIPRSDEHAS